MKQIAKKQYQPRKDCKCIDCSNGEYCAACEDFGCQPEEEEDYNSGHEVVFGRDERDYL